MKEKFWNKERKWIYSCISIFMILWALAIIYRPVYLQAQDQEGQALAEITTFPTGKSIYIFDENTPNRMRLEIYKGVECKGTGTISAGVLTFNANNCGTQDVTLNANITEIAFTNVPAGVFWFDVEITQDAATPRTVVFNNVRINGALRSVLWANGVKPTMSAGTSDIDTYAFKIRNDLGTPRAIAHVGGQNFGT